MGEGVSGKNPILMYFGPPPSAICQFHPIRSGRKVALLRGKCNKVKLLGGFRDKCCIGLGQMQNVIVCARVCACVCVCARAEGGEVDDGGGVECHSCTPIS